MPYTNLSNSSIDRAGVANMKVSEILQVKGNILYTVTPDQPLVDAVNTMAENDIGSLVVMEYGDLVGMLTFREVLKALHDNGGAVGAGTVRKHMDDQPDHRHARHGSQRSAPHHAGKACALPAGDECQDAAGRDFVLRRGARGAGSAKL